MEGCSQRARAARGNRLTQIVTGCRSSTRALTGDRTVEPLTRARNEGDSRPPRSMKRPKSFLKIDHVGLHGSVPLNPN